MTKDLQKRTLFAVLALAIFLPVLFVGGLLLQIGIGLLAMLAVHELLQMKGLNTMTIEGALTLFATFALTIPLENYLTFLPVDGNVVAYSVLITIMLGTTIFSKSYTIEDAAFPIAVSFYVGFGFQNLIAARLDSWEKVLFALFIVWATDIGAYLFGRQFGQNKLLPKVSPNKTIEGSIGGILSAIIVALIFGLINHGVYAPHNFFWLLICTILFSIFGQFGDLVESAIKRHFGVKDSGNLIPGHGGILDRCDSWIFVFPIMHFLGLF